MVRKEISFSTARMAGAFVLMLALVPVGMCQTESVRESEPVSADTPEEIVVYGKRSLSLLRREVYRSEEKFFAVFSSLNQDDEYDVRCYYEVPSFTHIRRHVCRAKFVTEAFSKNVGGPRLPIAFVIERRKKRLRQIMEALVVERPELLQALGEYTDAKQILNSEKDSR